jgi:tryptophanyl-tRNA synthetase
MVVRVGGARLLRHPALGPSHLGNYLGAQANYVALQDRAEAIYCIVDLHALTTVHDGTTLRGLTREMALELLAVGLDPKGCSLFRQSDISGHTELSWIVGTMVPASWLECSPTYKDKRQHWFESSAGLLNYPVLQTADIVLYQATAGLLVRRNCIVKRPGARV